MMADTNISGVQVEANLTINWDRLGADIARRSSDVQSEFLCGLATGLRAHGEHYGLMQLAFIADSLKQDQSEDDIKNLEWFLRALLEQRRGGLMTGSFGLLSEEDDIAHEGDDHRAAQKVEEKG